MAIIKKDDAPSNVSLALNKGKLRSTTTPFQQRVNQARQEQGDPHTMPNRIALLLDCSSSMSAMEAHGKSRMELLKDALQNFVGRCNFGDTALAVETFPPNFEIPLSTNQIHISGSIFAINASGNTPMQACVKRAIGKIPMTRAVIVSDGEATDWHGYGYDDEDLSDNAPADKTLQAYIEQHIPIDCVHISTGTGGEELLRQIAKATGGIFIKFTDVSAFAQAFGYLTPAYRAMLGDGRVTASDIRAREVEA